MTSRAGRAGFSLLELSIVILIIGFVTSIGMVATIGALDSARLAQTQNKMDVVEKALAFYRRVNSRMPCPGDPTLPVSDTNYGKAAGDAASPNLNTGLCMGAVPAANVGTAGSVVEGSVPVWDLNLPNEFMYDGWGRKLVYAVDSNATDMDAFKTIALPESCGITVNDGSGNPRTSGAVYVLMSYGPDGHGGYLQKGTRMNAGVSNGATLTNCHCTSSAAANGYNATYVQADNNLDAATDATHPFDDIVRFKNRWQLQSYDDQYLSTYLGPKLVAEFVSGGTNSAYLYSQQCGKPMLLGTFPNTRDTAFTPNNGYLLAFTSASLCQSWPINADGSFGSVNAAAVASCPTYNTGVIMSLSNYDYLAMTTPGVSPYVKLWKGSFSNSFTAIAVTPVFPAATSMISLTNNFLAVSDGTAANTKIYTRSGDTFTALPTLGQPASIPANPYSIAISPNEMYFAVTANSSPPTVTLWHMYGNVFAAPITKTIAGGSNPAGLTFSPDGKYFVLGSASGSNIVMFKIDAGDVFTQLPTPLNWINASSDAGLAFAFSNDSRTVAMMTADSAKPLAIFRQTNALQYHVAPAPSSFPASATGLSAAFSY